MKNINLNFLHYLLALALVIFTIALGVNNYNSGVYADAHQLDGASVGWFAPNGVLVFAGAVVLTVAYVIYLGIHRTKDR